MSSAELHGAVVDGDYAGLFRGGTLRDLWFLFLAITTRSNPANPAIMRKRELIRFARQVGCCKRIKTPNGPATNTSIFLGEALLEADIAIIHESERARSPGKKFTWTAFLRSVIAIARKVFRDAPTAEALRLFLEDHVIIGTRELVSSFMGPMVRCSGCFFVSA
jgi:hypothetical protein